MNSQNSHDEEDEAVKREPLSGIKDEDDDFAIVLRMFGEPYSNNLSFWGKTLPMVSLLGVVIGAGCLLFLFLYRLVFFSWAWYPHVKNSNGVIWSTSRLSGDWRWLLVTVSGGFLAGVPLLSSKAPSLGGAKNFVHDSATLQQGNMQETPFVILSSFISLCAGASIGPEMALGSFGSGLATYIGNKFRLDFRTQAALVLCGMGAGLGGIFPSPVLAILIMHELAVVSRPGSLRLDAVAEKRRIHNDAAAAEDIYNITNNSFDGARENQERKGHDYMEQITLVGVSATFAFITFQGIASFILHLNPPTHNVEFKLWYFAAAVPLGVCCGALGACFLLLNGIFKKIRMKVIQKLKRAGFSDSFGLLFLSTMTGLSYGIIAVAFPLTLGSGTMILPDVIKVGLQMIESQQKGDESSTETDSTSSSITPSLFLFSGIMKILSSSICLGIGLMGGQMLPLIFAGACIGIAVPCYFPFLPPQVTLPCCMASITGSFVPIPFTLSVFAMMKCGNSADIGATVLISVMVAYSCNAGLGLVQKGKDRIGLGNEHELEVEDVKQPLLDINEMDSHIEFNSLNEIDARNKEMVRDVSSLIFQ